jgi:hypothetical protein
VRKLEVCNCLIACYLFSCCILSAQNVSPLPPASVQENVESQPVTSTDLTSPAGSESATAVAEESPPAADPQSQGDGSANGKGTVNGNVNVNANRNKPAPAATTTYTFPTNAQIGEYWLRNMLSAKGFFGGTISASFDTWVHTTPHKWGHRRGWGKRFGVSLLDNSMNETAQDLLSIAMKQDPMYYRCGCSGVWGRAKFAIKQSFMSRNRSGDYVFSAAKIVSPFVGPMVTRNTIYPYGYKSSDAARGGAYDLAGTVGWNLLREFIVNIGYVVK